MKIAILAWGSLIERPEILELASDWQSGGPKLPVEFSRRSSRHRLTLVIDHTNGRLVPTQVAISAFTTQDEASENLRKRENTSMENIGFSTRFGKSYRSIDAIDDWLVSSDFDVVIWTALKSNFREILGESFSVDRGLKYLRDLPSDSQQIALDYFRIAPKHVMTPLRERLIAEGLLQ